MAAKNDPVDKQANVTDILDTFMASKKVSQCVAITRPENKKATKVGIDIFKEIFFTSK